MAVSKRTRYEILRRCNFACFYCGLPAPIAQLHVDHVIPRAHGGTDDPWNLVAACADCNLGKSNGMPDAETINRARDDWRIHEGAFVGNVQACMICNIPIQVFPDDDPAVCGECESCAEALYRGYTAGWKAAGRKPF